MLLEALPGFDAEQAVREALLLEQIRVAARPLWMKVYAHEAKDIDLAEKLGGVAIQLTPPWKYEVGDELRQWSAQHLGTTEIIADADRNAIRELEAIHYIAQHARWSRTASRERLLDYFADDHSATSPSVWDAGRSVCIKRNGCIVAAGLLWPGVSADTNEGREVSLLSQPYEGSCTRTDKEACLAAIIESAVGGEILLIDSHQTEALEREMMCDVPGRLQSATDTWMAIVAIPVPGTLAPAPIPALRTSGGGVMG